MYDLEESMMEFVLSEHFKISETDKILLLNKTGRKEKNRTEMNISTTQMYIFIWNEQISLFDLSTI